MATPTPGKTAASQQGRTPQVAASPPVSTPFSLSGVQGVFSPRGPRSSPQQVKRSPATTATLAGHPSTGPLNFDSPSAAAAMGSLGMGNALDIGLDNVGARCRDRHFIAQKGYVSEEGLERLVQRIGLDCIWDTQTDSSGQKMKLLVVAGKALQLDITIDNNMVRGVALSFPLSSPIVIERVGRATAILMRDLELRPGQSPLTKRLDEFYSNLSRLAELDKLSVIPGLDLQEALAGMCSSLERIHHYDLEKLRAEYAGKGEKYVHNMVTCHRHGYPVMHARNRVGLNLDYWIQRHCVPPKDPLAQKFAEEKEGVWSLLIGCAPMGEIMYPPVRISGSWISPKIEKEDPTPEDVLSATTGPALDWLEPENAVIPPPEEIKDASVDMTLKYAEVIFKALLEPTIILPQPAWLQMYELVGAQPPPLYTYPTFDSLYFPIPATTEVHDPSAPRTIEHRREVQCISKEGDRSTKTHKNTLYIYKPVYGQTLSELPFSHPKQLISLLPNLRQKTTPEEPASPQVSTRTVVFPLRSTTASATLEIGPNGKVRVISQNIVPDESAKAEGGPKTISAESLGRALEILEDIDQWCEWVRTRVDSS
ncbi:unnamed protein product [Parascedosporium putredinis]|uniref:Mediator of RNA polymerase II transcription subunit 1 n=1 Tax=Parascedosporium putredinis TaxID=1442378 RepID=A0A9P1H371_9PEZI|nr:unnamed protein product [Parascedosporium putredinis]CAI7995535.1 unnamed protein product [Parascedosporium putredinis]